jgi:hypothetical protein
MSDQMVASVGTAAAAVALSATVSGRSRTYLPAMMAAVGAGATVGYILPMSRAGLSGTALGLDVTGSDWFLLALGAAIGWWGSTKWPLVKQKLKIKEEIGRLSQA